MRTIPWLVVFGLAACSKADKAQQHHEDRADPATSAPALTLDVTIGGAKSTWARDAFTRTPHYATKNTGGDDRDTWSLRELAKVNIGPTARVVSVTGSSGTKVIDEATWNDPDHTPVIHTTRRGTLKYRIADKDRTWGPTLLNDVTSIDVVTP